MNAAAHGSSTKAAQTSAGKTTSKKPVDLKLFQAAAAAKLREINELGENEEYRDNPILLQAIELFEIANSKNVSDFDNAVVASAAFNDWIDAGNFTYQAPILYRIEDYHVSVTVQTKSGSLSVGTTIVPLTEDHKAALVAAKKELTELFNQAFGSASVPNLPEKKQTSGKKEYEVESDEVNILRAQIYNDKLVYQAIPVEGKWTQFGIPLYKDVAKAEGIELPDEEGEYEVNWEIQYELKDDGKPRRVIAIKDV